MNIVKILIAALMLFAGHVGAQQIIYQHAGPHHRTTVILGGGQPSQPVVGILPQQTQVQYEIHCPHNNDVGMWNNGRAICVRNEVLNGSAVQIISSPLRVEVRQVFAGGGRFYAPAGTNLTDFCQPNGCLRDERGWYRP